MTDASSMVGVSYKVDMSKVEVIRLAMNLDKHRSTQVLRKKNFPNDWETARLLDIRKSWDAYDQIDMVADDILEYPSTQMALLHTLDPSAGPSGSITGQDFSPALGMVWMRRVNVDSTALSEENHSYLLQGLLLKAL